MQHSENNFVLNFISMYMRSVWNVMGLGMLCDLWCLIYSVWENRRELSQEKSWLLHHSNSPAYIWQLLNLLGQPPYSTDLDPCDFFSFPQAQGDHQWDSFWRHGSHQEGCKDGADGYPRRIISEVYRSMAEKDV